MVKFPWRILRIVPLLAALAGCTTLGDIIPPRESGVKLVAGAHPSYRLSDMEDGTDPQYLILFAFSGGGKRSASFGYGALEAAHGIAMPDGTTLSQQIDIVSGVSGGSFPAAAFAMYREKLFDGALTDFKGRAHPSFADFLDNDTNNAILAIYLEPWRWQWMVDPAVGTNDEMEHTYESDLFGKTNFGDLAARGRPFLIVQATDLDAQQPFSFTQNDFNLICSDLSKVKLSRAIAASNGFPILFSPIGMQMFRHHPVGGAQTDGCPVIPWESGGAKYGAFSREAEMIARAKEYELAPDASGASYLHLADGGLSDNLALRGPVSLWTRLKMELEVNDAACPASPAPNESEACEILNRMHPERIKHILIVSVDGEAEPDRSETINVPVLGGLARIGNTVLNSVVDSANLDTLPLAYDNTQAFRKAIGSLRCLQAHGTDCDNPSAEYMPDAVFAHVALSDWAAAHKTELGAAADAPTGLSLPSGDAALLAKAGHDALLANPDFQCFLFKAGIAKTDVCAAGD